MESGATLGWRVLLVGCMAACGVCVWARAGNPDDAVGFPETIDGEELSALEAAWNGYQTAKARDDRVDALLGYLEHFPKSPVRAEIHALVSQSYRVGWNDDLGERPDGLSCAKHARKAVEIYGYHWSGPALMARFNLVEYTDALEEKLDLFEYVLGLESDFTEKRIWPVHGIASILAFKGEQVLLPRSWRINMLSDARARLEHLTAPLDRWLGGITTEAGLRAIAERYPGTRFEAAAREGLAALLGRKATASQPGASSSSLDGHPKEGSPVPTSKRD